ncbi:MAG: response regulator [Oscillospiraceae bacterium]|jgi:putative two-component system response regulator|nr:response regulator [Oscillospiraceae bacterium]
MESDRKIILVVDDNPVNLTYAKEILRDKFKVYPVPSAEIMFDLLENILPDLILLDIEMPDMTGYEAMAKIQENPVLAEVPVVFLTAKLEEVSELEGLNLGAIDYITKPFSPPLLVKRIENHLLIQEQKKELKRLNDALRNTIKDKTLQVTTLQNTVLATVADLVETRDDVTGGHVTRTQRYLELLVDRLLEKGLYSNETEDWNLDYLIPSAQLHDVGKIAISDLILNKKGKLTEEEFEEMKKHAAIGVSVIKRIEANTEQRDFMRHAKHIAGGHHEKWDGTGYPAGLKGTDIPLEGRLMAIADVYDALISHRPYKRPLSTEEAHVIILEGKGTHFDPVLVEVFDEVADKFAHIARDSAY